MEVFLTCRRDQRPHLNIPMLGFISAVTAALDVGLFFSSRATFQRGGSAL